MAAKVSSAIRGEATVVRAPPFASPGRRQLDGFCGAIAMDFVEQLSVQEHVMCVFKVQWCNSLMHVHTNLNVQEREWI